MPFQTFRFKGYRQPFFLLLMLVFATVIIGDNVAESLLLARYDASIIAKLFSLNAFFLFLFSLFMISLIDRIHRGKLFTRFLLFHSSLLFISWIAISLGFKALTIPLFSYAYVSKIFIFLLFWTLANDIVDSRKAARDFPKIAAGGTLGAITISFTIPFIVNAIPAESLLLVWASLTLLAAVLFIPIKKQFGRSFLPASTPIRSASKVKQVKHDIKTIGRDPLLKTMAFFYFLLFFVLLNQQYGFYEVLNSKFTNADEISRFLGFFNGTSMIMTFVLQISLSSWVIRRIGSTRAMLILPSVFTVVFLFLRITYQFETASLLFWGTVVGLGLRIAVFDSFYSPNFQVFFSSLPKEIRGRGKIALEGLVKPAAMVMASLFLTLVIPKIPETAATTMLVAASVTMVFLTLKMRKQYTRSLTRYLTDFRNRETVNSDQMFRSRDVIMRIREMIKSESYEVQCYLIELLADMSSEQAKQTLVNFLDEVEPALLPEVILALAPLSRPEVKEKMIGFLRHSDEKISSAAMRAVAEYDHCEHHLLPFLTAAKIDIQFTAIELLWWRVSNQQRVHMAEEIGIRLKSNDPEILFATMDLCGKIDDPVTTDLIPLRFPSFSDSMLSSNYAWKRFSTAVSDLEGESILLWILENADILGSTQLDSLVPAIENIIKTGYPVDKVVSHLETASLPQRFLLSKGTLLWGRSQKRFSKRLKQVVEREFELLRIVENQHSHLTELTTSSGKLLTTAIEEELLSLHRETAISLAALLDHKGEIRTAVPRLNHSDLHIRSRALEVLDNAGDRRINRTLLSHLSYKPVKNSDTHTTQILSELKENSNTWVRECAEFAHFHFSEGEEHE